MPKTETGEGGAIEITRGLKRVADYANTSISEVLELPCDTFQLYLKNSIVDELNCTKEGREYLETCKRLATTDMDLEAVLKLKDELENN